MPRCPRRAAIRRRALLPADLLVVTEREVDGAVRTEALAKQRLGGFQKANDADLVIQ
jgi:hypothetical protein